MTYLEVVPLDVGPDLAEVTFTVPGHQLWRPRAFYMVAHKEPNPGQVRSYALQVTDGTNIVAQIAADDVGDEPGTIQVTWAPTPAAASSGGPNGISVAPFGDFLLPPGYQVNLLMINTVSGDGIISAVAWVDYSYSDT